MPYTLSGDLGGFTIDPSAASVRVEFLDGGPTVVPQQVGSVVLLAWRDE